MNIEFDVKMSGDYVLVKICCDEMCTEMMKNIVKRLEDRCECQNIFCDCQCPCVCVCKTFWFIVNEDFPNDINFRN